jgi:hypothetical protein
MKVNLSKEGTSVKWAVWDGTISAHLREVLLYMHVLSSQSYRKQIKHTVFAIKYNLTTKIIDSLACGNFYLVANRNITFGVN